MPSGLHAEVETADTGLSVRMNLFIQPGQVPLSADEVRDWVTDVYEDARRILLQRVAVGETAPLRLVRSGHQIWAPSPLEEEETPASFEPNPLVLVAAAAAVRPREAPSEPAAAPAVVDPVPACPPTTGSTPPRRHRQGIERTRQGSKVLAVLKESDRPLDIATIKRQSKLTDYMTRTTLKALVEVALVVESWVEIGGRWGSKAVYALQNSGAAGSL
jgi:hypothetical protein